MSQLTPALFFSWKIQMKHLAWAFINMCDLYGKMTRVLTAINFVTGNPVIL